MFCDFLQSSIKFGTWLMLIFSILCFSFHYAKN
nr:MAG TPA: hypothetical protein [Caudoviricetes sp.]